MLFIIISINNKCLSYYRKTKILFKQCNITSKIINNYVGHFENTSLDKGNIGLAAHNRGQTVKAYFQNIKKLKKGDEIIYKTSNFERKYIVEKVIIIKETNWKYLENTTDNRITLITCVENEPQYRLCVQGIEKLN